MFLIRAIFKKLISFVLLFNMLLVACGPDEAADFVKKPDQLLSKDQMVSFLVDLHLAEAKISYAGIGKADSTERMFRNYEAYLFKKHHITDSVYYQSYEYYLAQMDQLDEIYASVVDSLSVLDTIEKNKSLE